MTNTNTAARYRDQNDGAHHKWTPEMSVRLAEHGGLDITVFIRRADGTMGDVVTEVTLTAADAYRVARFAASGPREDVLMTTDCGSRDRIMWGVEDDGVYATVYATHNPDGEIKRRGARILNIFSPDLSVLADWTGLRAV